MTEQKSSTHITWGSRWTFILAATGSAVGLGNIWKFSYITGENGGGAFVLVYLLCIALAGIPVMMAELLLGRMGRQSPISTMVKLSRTIASTHNKWWLLGWLGTLTGFLILTYYSVVAGWSLSYIFEMASGNFNGKSGAQVEQVFNEMLASPKHLLSWHSVFMLLVMVVAARGIIHGLEKAIRFLMPILFVLLILLVSYSATTDAFPQAVDFLFNVNFSKISWNTVLIALGHAFFTLSLGMGSIMMYGAYMPKSASIGSTVMVIAILDTVVALVAGLAIFPIVFSHGFEPSSGPGLIFVTLPYAFGKIVLGQLLGTLFFILIAIAAWSSAIALIEPAIAWAVERFAMRRWLAAVILCFLIWFIGLGTIFSFNIWDDIKLAGFNFFDGLDFLTTNIMLPLSGAFIAIYVGWILPETSVAKALPLKNLKIYQLWRWVLRFIAPFAILIIFVASL